MVRRFPARIGNWPEGKGNYSVEGLVALLRDIAHCALYESPSPGILLSAGIDSTILTMLIREKYPDIPCFTVGGAPNHPDVLAAQKLSVELNLDLRIYLPNISSQKKAKDVIETDYPGDEAVYLALEFAKPWVKTILATDGIDEQMGGYWWHVNENDRFSTTEEAFKYYWAQLEPTHLTPMFKSAEKVGLDINWVFLHPDVVDYISRIPLKERIKDGVNKAFWREAARSIGVPEWVINRPKRGFVNALDR